jgi:hypothetical protein
MTISEDEFRILLPLAVAWVEEQECLILRDGVPLSDSQLQDAQIVGVAAPGKMRVLQVTQIPIPKHPLLRRACDITGAITASTSGLSARYGIFLRADQSHRRNLFVHESVHTAQYERLGGVVPFLERYLKECITVGYPEGPMEQEAIITAARICG